ncbi:hypothetical protein ACQ4PT_059707 [Festuca glaucescens]
MDASATLGDRLPHDLLIDILGRLQCRDLALSRRVCRAWCSTVDGGALLLPHFYRIFPPRAFPGIFTSNYGLGDNSPFFTPAASCVVGRRTLERRVFRYPLFRHDWAIVVDHCNSLLLLSDINSRFFCVCNPATVRCAKLPPLPLSLEYGNGGIFIAFDPAVSPHHKAFVFPDCLMRLRLEKEVARRSQVEIPHTWMEILDQPDSCDLIEEDSQSEEKEEQDNPQDQLDVHEPLVDEPKDELEL